MKRALQLVAIASALSLYLVHEWIVAWLAFSVGFIVLSVFLGLCWAIGAAIEFVWNFSSEWLEQARTKFDTEQV